MNKCTSRTVRLTLGTSTLILLVIGQITAQNISRSHQYSHPTLPEPERLARHNLVVQWQAQLPTFNMKDAIHDIHVLGTGPRQEREQLLVQLKSGTVALLDAESGKQLWLARPDFAYEVVWPATWNQYTVFCQAKNTLFAYDRDTGRLQFKQPIPDVQCAPLTASDLHLFLSDERGFLKAYELPPFDRSGIRFRALAQLKERDRKRKELLKATTAAPETDKDQKEMPPAKDPAEAKDEEPKEKAAPKIDPAKPDRQRDEANAPVNRSNPSDARFMDLNDEPNMVPVWSASTGQSINFKPLQGENNLFVALNLLPENLAFGSSLANNLTTVQGGGFTLDKTEREGKLQDSSLAPVPNTPFLISRGRFVTGPVRFQNVAYVADDIGTVTAWGIEANSMAWKANVGGPVNRALMVTESDVFVTGERIGLWRLERATGEPMWRIPRGKDTIGYISDGARVLSVGPRVVYATDLANRLLLLDRQTGLRLGLLDTSAWVVPVMNNQTDRLYLAANDGSLVCLRDRDMATPFKHLPDNRRLEIKSKNLRQLVEEMKLKYGKNLSISKRAFQSIGMEIPYDKEFPSIDDMAGTDIGGQVRLILRKIGCRIETVGGQEFILPARSTPIEAPPPEEKAPPKEDADKAKEEKK